MLAILNQEPAVLDHDESQGRRKLGVCYCKMYQDGMVFFPDVCEDPNWPFLSRNGVPK